MGQVNPALVADIQTRLLNGWTFAVAGNCVKGDGPDGAAVSYHCDSEQDAEALLTAAGG